MLLVPAHEILGIPYAITSAGLTAYDALTAAVLNVYRVITKSDDSGSGAGGNVSSAILADGFNLGLGDSTEDDEKVLTDAANAVDLTDFNFDAELVGFRDSNPAAFNVFNLWRDLTFGPDAPYLIVHRVGYENSVAFASGQEIDVYYVHTDYPVPVHADGENLKISNSFITKNTVKVSYELSA